MCVLTFLLGKSDSLRMPVQNWINLLKVIFSFFISCFIYFCFFRGLSKDKSRTSRSEADGQFLFIWRLDDSTQTFVQKKLSVWNTKLSDVWLVLGGKSLSVREANSLPKLLAVLTRIRPGRLMHGQSLVHDHVSTNLFNLCLKS